MSDEQSVIIEHADDGIDVVRFNRPHRMNAMSLGLLRELVSYLRGVDPTTTDCIIVTGTGERAFGAGLDLKEAPTLSPAESDEQRHLYEESQRLLAEAPVPVIAAIEGVAAGGSLQLALACDQVVIADGARIGMPELSAGRPCIMGSYLLASRAGYGPTSLMVLAGQWFDAETAVGAGIGSVRADKGQALTVAAQLAAAIALSPKDARGATLRWLRQLRWGSRLSLSEAISAAEPILASFSDSAEVAARDRAFAAGHRHSTSAAVERDND